MTGINPYTPYTGAIDKSSKRYKAAKAMYDEGHAGNVKSKEQEKADKELAKLKMLKEMLGQKFDEKDMKMFKNPLEADEETFIRNYMALFDEDGDFVNSYGIAGMDITGKDPSEWHNIIDIPEAAREDMFRNAKREFMQENGVANGDTTKRSDVFARYQKSVPKKERLEGTWTLEQYERAYNKAFYDAAKKANPNWQPGMKIPAGALDGITRQDIEKNLVQSGSTFVHRTIDIKA